MTGAEADAADWARYRASRSIEDRNHLVERHIPMAAAIANAVIRRLPAVDPHDATAWAMLGLIEAVERFDPGRGWRFRTFATWRVRGAIFDGLRVMEGRQRRPVVVSLDEQAPPTARASESPRETRGDRLADPGADVESAGLASVVSIELARAIAALPARHQVVVRRWFYAGDTLAAIGADLGVTESRACQLKAEALARLRQPEMGLVA